jgi:hypothetical protein
VKGVENVLHNNKNGFLSLFQAIVQVDSGSGPPFAGEIDIKP